MADYTVDALIASARRRGQLPQSAGSVTDTDDLVALMDDELLTYIMPFLIGLNQEFAVADYTLTLVDGTAEYPLPARAIGGDLRDVRLLDGTQYRRLPRLEPERILEPPLSGSEPRGYYLKGNKIGFSPCGSGTAMLQYFKRPGRLVLKQECAQVTGINTGTFTVTLASKPSTFTTGTAFDFIQAREMFETLAMDQVGTVSGYNVTFAALPATLAVGDYLCLAGESCIPQIPLELHSLLAKRTNVAALEALGDSKGLQAALMMLGDAEKRAHRLLGNRVPGSPRYIINRAGPGWRSWPRLVR